MSYKLVVTIVAFVTLGSLSGCELFLGSQSAENFPPPGLIVEIDGRNLQIDCRGKGSPTVVLESGGNDIFGSLGWATVKDGIADSTRVCSYSRAGYMWSDSPTETRDAESVANDLHTALRLADEESPFLMVNHSRGSLFSLIFTDLFPTEVTALVLVEPRHPELKARRVQAGINQESEQPLALAKFGRALRWTGLPRAFSSYCVNDTLSKQDIEACKAYFPHSLDGIISENEILESVSARAAEVNDLGSRPVLVLTRQIPDAWYSSEKVRLEQQRPEALWRELHAEIATWSSQGEQRIVPESGHQIPFTHPQEVITGVKDIIDLVRQSSF